MAVDIAIHNGDEIKIGITDFPIIQLLKPVTIQMSGAGPIKVTGNKLCLEGDEKKSTLTGVSYNSGSYQQGLGTISIDASSLKLSSVAKAGSEVKPYILKGQSVRMLFTINVQAMDTANLAAPLHIGPQVIPFSTQFTLNGPMHIKLS